MKILSVRFKNINSLKGEHFINFAEAPIKDAGIFAITGATGSGKTTILDAISLALYDTTPRIKTVSNKVIKETGAILTRGTKESWSEVEYLCKEGQFTSKWSIRTRRTGTLAPSEMEIADASGAIITLTKKDAPKKNSQLIGLSYDQFIRSILLAQGEFAKFLTEKKDARSELLKQITGAWIYEDIGKMAFEMFKKHGEVLKLLNQRKEILLQDKQTDADFEALSVAYAKSNKELDDVEKQLLTIAQSIQIKQAVVQLEKEIKNLKSAQTENKTTLNEFTKTNGVALQKHRALAPILEDLREWKEIQKNVFSLEENKSNLEKELKEIKTKAITLQKKTEQFIGKKIKEFLPELSIFEQTVLDLEQQKDDYGKKYRTTFAEAKILLTELGLPVSETKFTQANKELKAQIKEIASTEAKLKSLIKPKDLSDPEKAIAINQSIREKIVTCQVFDQQLTQAKKRKTNFQDEKAPIISSLREFPTKIEFSRTKAEKFKAELDSLKKAEKIALLEQELSEHRHLLEDGKECPLCGATKHPYNTNNQPIKPNNTHDKILKKEHELTEETRTTAQLIANKKSQKERLNSIEISLKDTAKEIQEAQNKIDNIKKEIPQKKISEYDQLILENKQYEANLKKWTALSQTISKQNRLTPLLDQLGMLLKKGSEAKASIQKIYKGTDIRTDIGKIKDVWNRLLTQNKNTKKNLAKISRDAENLHANIKSIASRITPNINKSILEATKDILPESEYQKLSELEKKYQSKLQKSDVQFKTLQTQLEQQLAKTDKEPLDHWLTKQSELTTLQKEIKEIRDQQHVTVNQQKKIRKSLELLEKEIQSQEENNLKWVLLNDYIGDRTGNKFNSFAQDLTLHQLINLANIRLKSLNNRYELSVPLEGEDESLSLIDLDMGRERRSVTTLSGGEQFIVSLALALALSDLASRHIEINTLFIDEGFGTLDAELLDQIIDTLEKLQSESQKTIGIISHVPALKERITAQIRVVKNGQGHSQILVV